ncbi:MAG TPA: hypothetical protein VMT58_06005, partial [Candidatus Binataceae bacterium]|nr:hypothetical protein [Candidatus Binataceae bacterium]
PGLSEPVAGITDKTSGRTFVVNFSGGTGNGSVTEIDPNSGAVVNTLAGPEMNGPAGITTH